jgi:putative transposon-encoded protein
MPDASGNVFQQPFSIPATNDLWGDQLLFVFQDTATRIGLQGRFEVPQNYVGTASIIVVWSTTATTGDVELDFDYRAVGGDDAESLDQTGTQESVNQNDTAPSAAWERMTASLSLTSANLAAGDTVLFEIFRDGTDAGDTISASVYMFGLLFQYDDA